MLLDRQTQSDVANGGFTSSTPVQTPIQAALRTFEVLCNVRGNSIGEADFNDFASRMLRYNYRNANVLRSSSTDVVPSDAELIANDGPVIRRGDLFVQTGKRTWVLQRSGQTIASIVLKRSLPRLQF